MSERRRRAASTSALAAAEAALDDGAVSQLVYAEAIAEHIDAGGYDIEVLWDTCTIEAIGLPFPDAPAATCTRCLVVSRNGWCWGRCCVGRTRCCCSTSRTTTWTCRLEERLAASGKTILLVSHDRQLLANAAQRVVAVEDRDVWVHGEGFATFASARAARIDRIDELRRRWAEEHRRLRVVAAEGAAGPHALAGWAHRQAGTDPC